IPEIDLPGHMLAALTTFPNLGCTGGPYEVGTRWGIYDDVLCAGNEDIYPFIENVLKEVFELFPGEYVHIGGDECPKKRWKTCSKCQAKIKVENLKDEKGLQSYVIRKVEKFLNDNGKKLIGWDEILEGGIAPNAALMSWRGVAGGITAAKSGHPVIMTPNTHVYLDHYQANMDLSPLGNGRIAALEWTYNYNPIPDELTKEEASHIKGVQANLWTEYIRTPEQAEYMAYPRANAVAEIGWSTSNNISWEDYLKRLQIQFERWRFYGLNCATHYKK
ncbi:MAG: family 20 glycosylhydrolase, partial [Bacteroides sp.]